MTTYDENSEKEMEKKPQVFFSFLLMKIDIFLFLVVENFLPFNSFIQVDVFSPRIFSVGLNVIKGLTYLHMRWLSSNSRNSIRIRLLLCNCWMSSSAYSH